MHISRFVGRHFFLSNFYVVNVFHEGLIYPSAENAFQASKTHLKGFRRMLTEVTPADARRYGRRVELRKDWETVKLQVMRGVVSSKFSDPELAERLILTGDAHLVEGNTWGDTFWGVCNGQGVNNLGKILMQTRLRLAHVRKK